MNYHPWSSFAFAAIRVKAKRGKKLISYRFSAKDVTEVTSFSAKPERDYITGEYTMKAFSKKLDKKSEQGRLHGLITSRRDPDLPINIEKENDGFTTYAWIEGITKNKKNDFIVTTKNSTNIPSTKKSEKMRAIFLFVVPPPKMNRVPHIIKLFACILRNYLTVAG